MYTIARYEGEAIRIETPESVTFLEVKKIRGSRVELRLAAPDNVSIRRQPAITQENFDAVRAQSRNCQGT